MRITPLIIFIKSGQNLNFVSDKFRTIRTEQLEVLSLINPPGQQQNIFISSKRTIMIHPELALLIFKTESINGPIRIELNKQEFKLLGGSRPKPAI